MAVGYPFHSTVHGGAANYALGEAQRKRPPEDHTDLREGKRQRDSDSAGQYSNAVDVIGREVNGALR